MKAAQWMASLRVIDPSALTDPARRRKRLSALFLTDDEYRELGARFAEEVRALHRRLDRGPDRSETVTQFAERLSSELQWLLAVRYAGLRNGLRLPAPGRRPRFKASRRSGRPRKFTAEDEEWFLAEIDRWRDILEERGARVSDAKALRLSIANYYFEHYRAKGFSDEDAKRGARKMASRTGSVFQNRKGLLAKLRARPRR